MKMRIRILKVPEAKQGGLFNAYPLAGLVNINPFGLINSDTTTDAENISDSVKAVTREKANIEAEKGEVIAKHDLMGVYKINGKPHSKGGTPILADHGDFIFSNDKDLAISQKEADTFGFKLSKKKANNTPAKILQNELNPKEYNQMVAILKDPKSDNIAKATAQLMLSKYQEKIGQVAFLQESKKDFPQGLPAMSEGTAPVHATELKNVEEKEMMYAKQGGLVKAAFGFTVDEIEAEAKKDPNDPTYKGDKNKTKNPLTGVFANDWNAMKDFSTLKEYGDAVGFVGKTKKDYNPLNIQNFVMKMYPDIVAKYHNDPSQGGYGQPNAGVPNDGILGVRWNAIANAIRQPMQKPIIPGQTVDSPRTPFSMKQNPLRQTPMDLTQNSIEPPKPIPFDGFDIPWNAQEKLSTAAPFLTALAQPTYYDMLIQKHSPDIRLDRQSNEQELNDIRQQSSLAQREGFNNSNPQQAYLNSASARDMAFRQSAQSNAGVRSANTQIANQESLTNYATDQQDNMFNLKEIQSTYRNNVLSQQRRDEQLANGFTSSLNNGLAIQNNLDNLNQSLTAASLPYLTNVYYDAKGNVLGQESDLPNMSDETRRKIASTRQSSPIGLNQDRRTPYFTGYGNINALGVGNGNQRSATDMISKLAEEYIAKGATPDAAIKTAAYAFGQMYKPNQKGNSAVEELMSNMYRSFYPQQ